MPEPAHHAIVSIHDVMPHTLDAVAECLALTDRHGIGKMLLLVVPGCNWQAEDIARIREWVDQGHTLAGHGWVHDSGKPKHLRHRIHSALISRQVAEHLALDADGITELVSRCHAWFASVSLPTPEIYVPPAWAMGSISREQLSTTGFRWFEYQHGILDTAGRGRFHRMAVTGFEADTPFRRFFLRHWNRLNARLATAAHPGRLSIHPNDPALLLADQLEDLLASCTPVQLESLAGADANSVANEASSL